MSLITTSSQYLRKMNCEDMKKTRNDVMKITEIIPATEFELLEIEYELRLDKKDPISWAKSIAAFGCKEGGLIIVGVDNDGNIAGISYDEVDETKNLVYRIIDRMVKPSLVPIRFGTRETEIPKRYVLIIHVGKGHQILYIRKRHPNYSGCLSRTKHRNPLTL